MFPSVRAPCIFRFAQGRPSTAESPDHQLRLKEDGDVLVVDIFVAQRGFQLQTRRVDPLRNGGTGGDQIFGRGGGGLNVIID